MKFAGLHGKEVRIIGKNRETLTTAKAALLAEPTLSTLASSRFS